MVTLKDESLARLATTHNVARFVSFGPRLVEGPRELVLSGGRPGHMLDYRVVVTELFRQASAGSVNVRSFRRESSSGNPFVYGLDRVDDACVVLEKLAARGYYTIVNETVDVLDGGVSGVMHGSRIEFAFGATPRAVETGDHVSMPRDLGLRLLERVYGFSVDLQPGDQRLEFSLHPLRVGVRAEHALVWEAQDLPAPSSSASVDWPNNYSRVIGDKTFGLLVADTMGFPVPRTLVFSRDLAPFTFGRKTRVGESWIRTAPRTRTPGKFTTQRGWIDPFTLMHREDPDATLIAAVLAQDGIDARFSGATITDHLGEAVIEGVPGFGDDFMQGSHLPSPLPAYVLGDVHDVWARLSKEFPAPSFEWVHDGQRCWVVQLHSGSASIDTEIVAGAPKHGWIVFKAGDDLDVLRGVIDQARRESKGVRVSGRIGITSHVGDLLRKADIPSRIGPD